MKVGITVVYFDSFSNTLLLTLFLCSELRSQKTAKMFLMLSALTFFKDIAVISSEKQLLFACLIMGFSRVTRTSEVLRNNL